MTRLLLAFALGFMLAWALCQQRKPRPCPEYKVYGEAEVQEWETLAKTRRLSK